MEAANPNSKPVTLFYSYSHRDEALRDELETHLSLLRREGIIQEWHDRRIGAGKEWADSIDENLEAADVVLLLISADFLASDYCYDKEMKRALEKHEADELCVIPIIIRAVDWTTAPFSKLQALPRDDKAVTSLGNRDEAWKEVAKGIREEVEKLKAKQVRTALNTIEVKAEKLWNVPYPHNPFFTGRGNVIEELYSALKVSGVTALAQPQAISGLGGVGKTQTAVEYAYRYSHEYDAVLWVKADSRESLISDYVVVANMLNLPGKNLEDQNLTVAAVKRWLENNTGWLLILDNADDPKIAREFIPSAEKGHVLLTTRAQAMGGIAQRIEIEKMAQEEAVLFLLRRANIIAEKAGRDTASQTDQEEAEAIVKEMDGLPLALDQAGAYIEETSCGLSGYLDLYQSYRSELLKRRGDLVSDHPESVATTWDISFKKIEEANPAATELLRFCAFLHPDEIPEELFTKGASELEPRLQIIAEDLFELNTVIREILKFSLLRRNSSTKTLNIHRLVQAVLKDDMNNSTQRQWVERAVRVVNQALPRVEFPEWPHYERLLSQAQTCIALIRDWDLEFPESARMLDQTGEYLRERARFGEAGPLLQRSLAIREKVIGPESPDVATSLNNLAELYRVQGKYAEAEPFYSRALEIREKVFGEEHPDVAASLNNLALLYGAQGKHVEEETLHRQALEIREKVLESEHPDVAKSLHNLAYCYFARGQYQKAAPFYQQAREILEKALGAEHPDVAISLGNIAGLYRDQGRYEEAEPLYLQARAIREKVLGAEHPDMASGLNNLATLYSKQGKYTSAESLYKRAQSIIRNTLGPDHPNMAVFLDNYAGMLRKAKKKGKAAKMSNRAKAIRAKHAKTNPTN